MTNALRFLLFPLILLFLAGGGPKIACSPRYLPHVLIIGDSISLGTFPYVKQHLKYEAVVTHNEGNAFWSAYTLAHLDEWLAAGPAPDLVVWNNGLHDLSTRDLGRRHADIGEYKANLQVIGSRLKTKGIKVLFLTTTHIPIFEPYRNPADLPQYNAAAKDVMAGLHIPVYDLEAVSEKLTDLHKNPVRQNDVHYTREGYRILADHIAGAIRQELAACPCAPRG